MASKGEEIEDDEEESSDEEYIPNQSIYSIRNICTIMYSIFNANICTVLSIQYIGNTV